MVVLCQFPEDQSRRQENLKISKVVKYNMKKKNLVAIRGISEDDFS